MSYLKHFIAVLAAAGTCSWAAGQEVGGFSGFENGALDSLKARTETVFLDIYPKRDPDNPVDTLLEASSRWYNFRLGGLGGRTAVMRFHGSEADRPFFSYDGLRYERFEAEDVLGEGMLMKRFDRDSVWISYFIPYTYSYLKERLGHWSESPYVKVGSAGESTLGRDMPLLVVTDPDVPDSGKKVVYIHGRTHTSEAPSSWHLDAMTELLAFSDDPQTAQLRREAVFYIVPFANPDGVVLGLSRSNAEGINQEVNWDRPDSLTCREVRNLKALIGSLVRKHGRLDIALNMHSQTDDYATFWIHTAQSTSESFFEDQMRLARLTADGNPYLEYEDLSYSDLAPRYAEGWIWKLCGEDALAVTFETPYTHYGSGEWVSPDNLAAFAGHSLRAIADYLHVSCEGRMLVPAVRKRRFVIREQLAPGTYRIMLLGRTGSEGWTDSGTVRCDDGVLKLKVDGRATASVMIKREDN